MAKVEFRTGFGWHTVDAVTFRAAFVRFSTEQVFLRTHLISFTVCVGRAGSEPEQRLCEIENLGLPNHFFFHYHINDVLDADDHSYTKGLACHRLEVSFFCAYRAS